MSGVCLAGKRASLLVYLESELQPAIGRGEGTAEGNWSTVAIVLSVMLLRTTTICVAAGSQHVIMVMFDDTLLASSHYQSLRKNPTNKTQYEIMIVYEGKM